MPKTRAKRQRTLYREGTPPTAWYVAARIAYDPQTGCLTWKRRPLSDFLDATDQARWNSRFAGKPAGCVSSESGYRLVRLNDRLWRGHQIAWAIAYGEWPVAQIDHINGVRWDNRLANLRQASHAQNVRNQPMRANNTTGFKGVSRKRCKFRATITAGGKQINLGSYDSPERAFEAYKAAAFQLHGEFANVGEGQPDASR